MSTFSVYEFYQRNRRLVIWAILFGLLWLLRDFFGLVFLSFVLAIIAAPIAEFGERRLKLPHWLALALVYLLFLVLLGSFVRFVVPSVASEVNRMIGNLPDDRGSPDRGQEPACRSISDACASPLSGFLASALRDDLATTVERRLVDERIRLSPDRWRRSRRQWSPHPAGGSAGRVLQPAGPALPERARDRAIPEGARLRAGRHQHAVSRRRRRRCSRCYSAS